MDAYFTFGHGHIHRVNGYTYDRNVVVKITADSSDEARKKMFDTFGPQWAFQYDNTPPDLAYFPRGIKELNNG